MIEVKHPEFGKVDFNHLTARQEDIINAYKQYLEDKDNAVPLRDVLNMLRTIHRYTKPSTMLNTVVEEFINRYNETGKEI